MKSLRPSPLTTPATAGDRYHLVIEHPKFGTLAVSKPIDADDFEIMQDGLRIRLKRARRRPCA